MSIEEMQKLKEEIGLKLFNKAVKGDSGGDGAKEEEKRRRHFPRDNKVCGTLGSRIFMSSTHTAEVRVTAFHI